MLVNASNLGYQTYPATTPPVRVIKIKTESELKAITDENKTCDLQIYFLRPTCLHNLTYCVFFQQYTYSNKLPRRFTNNSTIRLQENVFEITVNRNKRKVFIFPRESAIKSVTRLEMVPLNIGEKWYLRLISYHKPSFSFKTTKTIDGITHQCFQLAALAAKLVEVENEALIAFEWATVYSTPSELRSLFVIMTTQGFPTIKIFENNNNKIKLMEDFL